MLCRPSTLCCAATGPMLLEQTRPASPVLLDTAAWMRGSWCSVLVAGIPLWETASATRVQPGCPVPRLSPAALRARLARGRRGSSPFAMHAPLAMHAPAQPPRLHARSGTMLERATRRVRCVLPAAIAARRRYTRLQVAPLDTTPLQDMQSASHVHRDLAAAIRQRNQRPAPLDSTHWALRLLARSANWGLSARQRRARIALRVFQDRTR